MVNEVHDDLLAVSQSCFFYENSEREDKIYSNLETIPILLKNPNYKLVDGFMVNTKHKTALFYAERNKKEVRIPDGIEIISTYCFDEYGFFTRDFKENAYFDTKLVSVEKVTIPKSVKQIRNGAFYHCRDLKSVIYEGESSDLKLGDKIFSDCGVFSCQNSKIICADSTKKQKSKTAQRLKRIKIIHKMIKSCNYPNAEELLEACNNGLRDNLPASKEYKILTIYRDIQFMKKVFAAPIDYDFSEKGYYYCKNFTLNLD